MTEVPQNPHTFLGQSFKDTAFSPSQSKMLFKLVYSNTSLCSGVRETGLEPILFCCLWSHPEPDPRR